MASDQQGQQQGQGPFSEGESAAAPQAQQEAPQQKKRNKFIVDWDIKNALRLLRGVNMVNGMLMIALGLFVFITEIGDLGLATGTLALYLVAFGIIMTCVECNIGNLQDMVRAQCGFLFNYWGRTIFIFFAATLSLSIGDTFGYVLGSVSAVTGLLNLYVICVHPKFRDGSVSRSWDPFVTYTGGEEEMVAYLKRNPELARKAGSSVATAARNNPELARSAYEGATHQQQQQPRR
eukprot:gb/GECG01011108.1/.p1 GENE.gb/GECG01011108.1/~~gb/GECG01011108.1/.p1  ORF type:complete len:235 (+),score=25.44 gb/GECG01011108.1/:1-705(+)